jgi:antitoxin (DNA-binding transcriptional repressor) of toxin-antitoxin stability system
VGCRATSRDALAARVSDSFNLPDLAFPLCIAVYNRFMAKHIIHLSEKEAAATNVETLLAHVRAGTEVVIENGSRPIAVIHPAEPVRRTISGCIALLPEDSTAIIDADFAKDVEAAIESHCEPLSPPAWD